MIKNILISAIGFCFLACNHNVKTGLTNDIIIANTLIISTYNNTKFVVGNGIDSDVAYLITDKGDTLHIEYGNKEQVNNLYSLSPTVFPLSQKDSITKIAGHELTQDEVLFSEYPEEDREEKIFDKEFFMYDTINKIVVKIVRPKKRGYGITGLFIPKLKNGKSFCIYAKNLDNTSELESIQMFATIRYK